MLGLPRTYVRGDCMPPLRGWGGVVRAASFPRAARCDPCSTLTISTASFFTRYTAINGSGENTSSRVPLPCQIALVLGTMQAPQHRHILFGRYALQTASVNLRNAEFEADEATDVVIDRDDVHRTTLRGPQWFEEDFEDDAEEEDEVEDEADGEDAVAAAEVKAPVVPRKAAEAKHVSLEEARAQVHGVVRDWLLATAGENAAAEPS